MADNKYGLKNSFNCWKLWVGRTVNGTFVEEGPPDLYDTKESLLAALAEKDFTEIHIVYGTVRWG